jgi:glycosyltransferase involved in cell wall biosynthesis
MRILLVTYYFPPFNSVGAVRPGKLARFFHEQGHDLHVLTCSNQPYPHGLPLEIPPERVTAAPAWSVNAPVEWVLGGRAKVAREGFGAGGASSRVQRLGHLYRSLLHWPDAQRGWVGGALRAGRALLARERFELVYVSAPPFSGLKVGATLAREAGLPWVAELRDLWTDNHGYAFPRWRRALERRSENRLLRSASALVTVSAPLANKLHHHRLPVWEVRNGCDPEDFAGLPAPEEFVAGRDTLELVFTGNVYPGHYDVGAFCAGLKLYLDEGGSARVHVAGRNTAALQQAAQRLGVTESFRFHPTLPRAAALAMQRHADVLLFFVWDSGTGEGVFSLKLFEYAGAGRPVLAVGTRDSDVARLIVDAGLGQVCTEARAVADQLWTLQRDKQQGRATARTPRPGFDLTRSTQFRHLERQLANLVAGA